MLSKCKNCVHLKIEFFDSNGGYFAHICAVSLVNPHNVVSCGLFEEDHDAKSSVHQTSIFDN